MTLKTQMTSDLPVFFDTDEFGQSITYTPTGGSAVSITAILESQDATIQDPVGVGDARVLLVKTSEVSNPQKGDTFTIDSETWYLLQNIGGGSNEEVWQLAITRSERRPV